MDFKEIQGTVKVPKNAGVDGFLAAMKAILKRPRVQSITVDNRGTIRFSYIGREDERDLPLPDIDFETLTPIAVVRSNEVAEVAECFEAPLAVASLFRAVSKEMLFPVAFVTGPGTPFWRWHEKSGVSLDQTRGELYGYPLLYDDQIPDHVLILCASYVRGGALLDTRKSFKITLPMLSSSSFDETPKQIQAEAAELYELKEKADA